MKGDDVYKPGMRKSRIILIAIFLIQMACLFSSIVLLILVNLFPVIAIRNDLIPPVNAALWGYVGSLIYFSRKSYVYLITNKFLRIHQERIINGVDGTEQLKNTVTGYYLYLLFRPFVGAIIGPILYMLAITGLITFMKASVHDTTEISRSGRYLIYIISFLGGHASSDVLDYFSRLAKRIVIEDKDQE